MPAAPIEVVAGALIDGAGRILVAERPAGRSRAGRWELPGGKREPGETPRATLHRELEEELGISVRSARWLINCRYQYPGEDKLVHIDAWRVEAWSGEPRSLDGQRLQWLARGELDSVDWLEADLPIVTALALPERFVRATSASAIAAFARTPGQRIGWLVPSSARGIAEAIAPGDWLGVIDPGSPFVPGPDSGNVYTPAALSTMTAIPDHAGAVIYTREDARRARARGCAFLLLAGSFARETLAEVANLSLPWYVDDGSQVLATGQLSWRNSP